MFYKKGVSLVTVLMFMLIATIAATATFKWLTSESRSSASRMEMQEAYQSAVAGIQSTRAWMTNNANDVGAMIRQYKKKGNHPLLLNDRVLAQINSKQNFNVWLAGVNEVNGFFKIKIISEGIARHDAKHTEAAIFNVSGLHQMEIPIIEEKVKNIAYDYSYFGASISNHGSATLSSMLINGNWYGNPIGIEKNLIITGNARLSGDNVNIYGTGCIGGNLFADNGIDAKNIFIGGTATQFGTKNSIGVSNHAYFDGDVVQDQNRPIIIGGNMTANKQIKTSMNTGSASFTVEGNMCLGSGAQVQIGGAISGNTNINQTFKVNGDVWINHPNSFYTHGDFHDNYYKIILGSKSTSKAYIKDAYPSSNYLVLRNQKKFVENEDFRQNCSNPVYGTNKTNACYNKNSDDANRVSHQWDYWQNESYQPYGYREAKDDKYYFYNVPTGETDIEFKEYDSSDWLNKTSGSWQVPTPIGAYHVGGKVFYRNYLDYWGNRKEEWNEYHYGTDYDKKMSPYCLHGSDKFRPECYVSPWFKSEGTVTRDVPSTPPITCADSVKKVCDAIWDKKPGCDNAPYKVNDILKTAYDKFEEYASKGCASSITLLDNDFAKKLNSCYNENVVDENKKNQNLYNGYLVVSVKAEHLSQNFGQELKGKFIVILENKPNETVALPPTESNSYVFLYIKEGAYQIQGLNQEKSYNYFIYTKADIGTSIYNASSGDIQPNGGFLFNTDYFKGSIYAEAENCVKVAALTSSKPMTFNQELLNDLSKNKVICDVSVSNCGGVAASSSSTAPSSSASSEESTSSIDPYYIAIAPQLNITLETQYKTTESPTETTTLDSSILVLPRIIYLSKDAPGTLEDYYSAIKLNSSNKNKKNSNDKAICDGSIPTTGKLVSPNTNLEEGLFKCEYKTSYDSNPFYVVVVNATGELPEVNFTETSQSLNLGENVTVSVKIDKAASSSGKIKFDFSIPDVFKGWSITPAAGIVERAGTAGRRYFTVEATPNETQSTTIPILTVSTEAGADDGDLYIHLSTPTENCKLGGTYSHHIYVRGRTYITRASLSDYCDNFTCNELLKEKSLSPDCDYEGEWVTVNGSGCSVNTENNRWSCLTTSKINLVAINTDNIPSSCEVFIPNDNNSISEPQSGENKNLYASIKRKKTNLTINFSDAYDKTSYIRVYDQNSTEENKCYKQNAPCVYSVIAGNTIIISHEDRGSDKENFAYWSCSGSDCSKGTIYNDENEFKFFSNHTITAEYRKESHCYYDDFNNTYAFCKTNSEDCIDTCSTALTSSQHCQPRNNKQPKSHWLMTYHNNGNKYIRPVFGSNSIFISEQSVKPTIILRNQNAGQYGTMNALVQTAILEEKNTDDILNTGFIFRSNGNEHILLNVYGVNQGGQETGNLTFRVCHVEGQSVSNPQQNCELVPKNKKTSDITITGKSFIKIAFTIDNKDYLSIRASVNDQIWNGGISVKDFGYNDITHTNVGFSLANSEFKLFDNGWTSLSFNEACWDIPTIYCSFADNYVGETVPLNQDVTPKVTMSSWFTEKNCTTEFHYNGCDNTTSSCINGSGEPGEIGAALYGDTYHFTEEGIHGYLIGENIKEKDASVKIVCPGDQTSLDLSQDYYSCGTFHVGNVYNCTDEISIFEDLKYMSENEVYKFSIQNNNNYINMRGSVLHIDIETDDQNAENILNARIEIQLQSTNGMKSLSRTISTSGLNEISVDILANAIGFDPQQVSDVILKSSENIYFKKLHIYNKCNYKFEFDCSKLHAKYDFNAKGWSLSAPSLSKEASCSYTPSDNNIEAQENVIGCGNALLTYKTGTGFIINNQSPTFTVTATYNNSSRICTIQGESSGNVSTTCRIPNDQTTISYGSQAPPFIFKIGEKAGPGAGYNIIYHVSLDGGSVADGNTKVGTEQTVQSTKRDFNSGSHQYKVDAYWPYGYNQSFWLGSCTADFLINDAVKEPATVNCEASYVTDKKYNVSINNPDNVNYTYVFSVTDNLGNVIEGQNGSSAETSLTYEPSLGKAGVYKFNFVISGDNSSNSCTKSVTITSPIVIEQCPNITDQDNGSIITINPSIKNCEGCTYKIFYGDLEKSNDLSFYEPNGTGTIKYKLQVTDIYSNEASCDFKVSFKDNSSSSETSTTLNHGTDWVFFDEGRYSITCTNQYSGHLICKCPNTAYGHPDCNLRYNGILVNVKISQNNGQNVDVGSIQCQKGNTVEVEILPPNAPDSSQTQQGKGMYCKHDW